MSKAEDFAIKNYPVSIEDVFGHKVDVNLWQRKACVEGYQQAEKDNKLTWKDIEKITDIWDDLHEDETVYSKTGCDTPEFYQEVLKRFKKK
jgi:hypothetical protein